MLSNSWVQGLIFISAVYNPVLTANSTLKFISVIARHVDRAPEPYFDIYPKDPYKGYNFDPPGYGKVSKSGELRAMNLGKFLAKTYSGFLATNYISGAVEARSTDLARTKESLNFILKGLYPEAVVPTTFVSTPKDVLLYPQFCVEYITNYVKAMKESANDYFKFQAFMDNLYKWTGKTISFAFNMYGLYTTLEAEQFLNLTLPTWTKGVYPDGDLLKGTLLEFDIMNYNEKLRRGNGGRLIKKIKEDMESVKSGTMDKNRKLMLYVAHDLNVVALLKALGVFYPHAPKFSSAVIVELHLIDKVYHVQIKYYLGIPEEIKTLQIPDCKPLCPLDQFSALMKKVLPSELDLECDKHRSAFGYETATGEVNSTLKIFRQMVSE